MTCWFNYQSPQRTSCSGCGASNAKVANSTYRYPRRHSSSSGASTVASVIPDSVLLEQVDRPWRFYRTPIPAEFWQELRSQNLIQKAAPLPSRGTESMSSTIDAHVRWWDPEEAITVG